MRMTPPRVALLVLLSACSPGNLTRNGPPISGDDAGVPPPESDARPEEDPSIEVPLTPTPDNSSGVTLDGNSDLVLDADGEAIALSHIWIANSGQGTVSKIDTQTGQEVARYRTGPGSPDPSRTTVGLNGDVVVANRGGSSAVRIHADPATCPDLNANGTIETSTGPLDVRPWGQDECVLWYHAFPANSIARAAAFDFVFDPDGVPSSSVWIGLYQTNQLIRLDAQTGEVLSTVNIPGHCPYGLAFDGSGDLWAFSACSGNLVHVDTATLEWSTVPLPNGCAYGIAVDSDGDVWTSGGSCVGRYDPDTGNWSTATVGQSNRGLAHDGAGSVWVADTDFGVHRLDATTMAVQANIPLAGGGFVGMAVDFHGKVWAVSRQSSQAYRIDPASLASQPFPTGPQPYTYSDMTGFQLHNAAPPLGLYSAVVEGCGADAQWLELVWTATTPSGTFVQFRARTADSAADLANAEWATVAKQPDDVSPADLAAALESVRPGGSFGAFLEIGMTLSSSSSDYTPTLDSVRVTASCPPIVE